MAARYTVHDAFEFVFVVEQVGVSSLSSVERRATCVLLLYEVPGIM